MKKNNEIIVLVVDDEEGLRKALVCNLQLEDFQVLSAASGNEALEFVKSQHVDFVLSDVRMPKGDGIELLKNIKNFNGGIPVVLLVTGFTEHTKDEVLALGAIDLLNKPADIDYVVEMIKKSVIHRS